ncbi:hypothetical protein [Methylomicrobium lacus]|uniref:hypothetical protein n=1 Tax=Methylomicrobium lacus TaxID=136992 RepID=UPI00045E9505|nr:hypothetical protein [Methylomicrobium lacus]
MLKILKVEHEVKNRLALFDLKKELLAEVAIRAISQKRNAVSNHPVNAAGTFAYHEGVRSMRDLFVDGATWTKLVENGIEYIENSDKKLRVIYQNVDYACNSSHDPQPLTKRGGSAKSKAISSNQVDLFGRESTNPNVWVICVSEKDGVVNAELSKPTQILENGEFSQFKERIFILEKHDMNGPSPTKGSSDSESTYDDDVKISFKG